MMPVSLAIGLAFTDIAFLAYWAATAAYAAGWIDVPADYLFSNYHDPRVVGWNWSFLPLDVAFSISGLAAVRASAIGSRMWKPLAVVSLCLSSAAGLMAISYWIVMWELDPFWFTPNLALFLWPLTFVPGLVRELGGAAR